MEQRAIYDERYVGTGYDCRSAVRVLTAEATALRQAAGRALDSLPESDPLSLFDFGYGTGRVTNDFAVSYPTRFRHSGRNLRVIAYDISAVGLHKAAMSLIKEHGFDQAEPLSFENAADAGYVAGSICRLSDGIAVTVVFVHGNEHEGPETVRTLIEKANDGRPTAITTSWYSALAHIPLAAERATFFAMLSTITDARGELLIAPSVTGDLVELQAEWAERLRRGDIGDYPIELPGDVIYETELAQKNFYHIFETDLADLLEANRAPGQQAWLEAIRLPDPEFASVAAEQANFRRVQEFNHRVGRRPWRPEEYRQVHTAVAIRSGHPDAGTG